MNQETRYKYFSLIIKILIGVGAFGFIVFKLKKGYGENLNYLKSVSIHYTYVFMALALMIVNWSIETYKWNYLIKRVVKLSFFKAVKIVITGITISLITPNRIGEIPGRVYLLNVKDLQKDLMWLTTLGSFTQFICTLLFGALGIIFTYPYFNSYLSSSMIIFIFCLLILAVVLVFKLPAAFKNIQLLQKIMSDKLSGLSYIAVLKVLLMSGLRYGVFFLQYLLLLWAFNIPLMQVEELMLIPVCFLFASAIPTFLLSEIGVRSSVALFVFGMVSEQTVAIVLASIVLWTFNIAIPGLIGIFNLKQLKLFNP